MKSNIKKKNVVIHNEKKEELRINKYISETGICSRREADKLIEQGRVTIDGQIATTGTKVGLNQKVLIDGKPIAKENEAVYIVLNKPVGITCTTEKKIKGNIVDFVNHKKRIFPIGRLDKDSQGLILLTNDGDIVNKILRAGNNHEKEYIVTVNKPITDEFITNMAKGVPVLGVITKKCVVKREGKNVFRIVLTQGLNRQIRRMCEYFGYKVVKLERIRIMNINLGNLKIGQWRELNRKEIDGINKLISDSVKTEEASTP
ncbi:23S rRNA pseudouridine(2604) synthase RluF [Clostridium fungisolvens]|uniref:Pseudouridine synthase n=1 Tax=Clostridium fungisolvens TaxID=1604897 RepID=A0A6V8SLT4_9CLOT|nr:23S rRNA pseudouridine(2604) synthase RluF [Clostridium fungisolvens]GFP77701.1 Dual-specificity RNA pseudouridine synthase RluF [Clostridium fungisolvens]